MFETFQSVHFLSFIFAIALLVAIHEYGHFIAAIKLGIRVEKFSIGFGPKLFSWSTRRYPGVEFIIAAIPMGGYVKLYGESESQDNEVEEIDRDIAFFSQPIWKRAVVAVAGPVFNFIFAIVAYMLIGWLGQEGLPSYVGYVQPGSLAERSGIHEGDRIVSVDGQTVESWQEVETALKALVGQQAEIGLDESGQTRTVTADMPLAEKDPLLIQVSRDLLGISPGMQVKISGVVAESAAEEAKILSGDKVVSVDGIEIRDVQPFINYVQAHAGTEVNIRMIRDGETRDISVTPRMGDDERVRIGVQLTGEPFYDPILRRNGPVDGLIFGFTETWRITLLTFEVIYKMVVNTISPENIGGPIAIAKLAGDTASIGLVAFLNFLALISVNLGVLNLLPIPVLDGGHLMYLLAEKIKGSPLSLQLMQGAQAVGIVLLLSLMVFAFYNDITRYFFNG